MLITHDLGVIAQMAGEVAVMYGGSIIETAETRTLFQTLRHPYTWGLFQALPRLGSPNRVLRPIQGMAPIILDPPDRCPYLRRCPKAISRHRTDTRPKLEEIEKDGSVACSNPVGYEKD